MITLEAYLGQHARGHEDELTPEIKASAEALLARVQQLLAEARLTGPKLASGWRPREVNAKIPGAAPASKHSLGQAIDIVDVERDLADFCIANLNILADIGLWMEDPRCTPTWTHLQSVPPKSGKRVFIPDAFWAARLANEPKFS